MTFAPSSLLAKNIQLNNISWLHWSDQPDLGSITFGGLAQRLGRRLGGRQAVTGTLLSPQVLNNSVQLLPLWLVSSHCAYSLEAVCPPGKAQERPDTCLSDSVALSPLVPSLP